MNEKVHLITLTIWYSSHTENGEVEKTNNRKKKKMKSWKRSKIKNIFFDNFYQI